ncbi:MAG: hypothetical protein N3D18_06775 [Roseococcus sp.]|nr:hypothetical protein [Roseococcus sp.]
MTPPPEAAPTREGLRDCPHCGEPSMANRLPDGALVCSCPAMRPLPSGPRPFPVAPARD